MNVALVNPALDSPVTVQNGLKFHTRKWPPLDLLNTSTLLDERKISNTLIDAHAMRLSPLETGKKCAKATHVIITSSTLDRWQCPLPGTRFLAETLRAIREENGSGKIILCGAHSTVAPKKMLKENGVDKVACGGESAAVAALFSSKKTVTDTSYGLDGLSPNYSKTDSTLYSYELLGDRLCLLETARGCPYKCDFCFKSMYPEYAEKKVERVIYEIKEARRAGYRNIYFIDLTFTLKRERAEDICEEIISQGVGMNWTCQTRVDLVDAELLSLMKKAGCKLVHFGVESNSDRILQGAGKGTSTAQAFSAVKACREQGIGTLAFFMLGAEFKDAQKRHELLQFAKKLNPTYVSFTITTPYNQWCENAMPASYLPEAQVIELNRSIQRAYVSFYCRPLKMIEAARRINMPALKLFSRLAI